MGTVNDAFSFAGLRLTRFIKDLGLAEKNIVVHDSLIALYGATLGRRGIILIAGTGSVAQARTKRE